MKINTAILFIVCFVLSIKQVHSQEGIIKDKERKKQYEKIINQANQLFNAKEYTASIYFYKKALEIAPEKKLAKYRLEDIATIFIKEEKAEDKNQAEELITEINKTISEIEEQLPEEKKDSLIFYISDIPSANVQKVDENIINDIKMNNRAEIDMPSINGIEEKQNEVANIDTIQSEKNVTIKPQTEEYHEDKSEDLNLQRKKIEEELLKKYPDKKTVEIINEPHRTIKRVIINKNNQVTVFLEVKYDWGGVYYFIDKTPFPSQSITKNYFMKHTNIENEE
ncbi:MAG: hypothetical protein Kow0068_04050 [Marinilabiliales bacterium]